MRKSLQIISIVLLLAAQANGQEKGKFGLKIGYNSSMLSASVNSDASAKGGIALGAYYDIKTKSFLHFQPEINYSSQGENENYMAAPNGPSIGTTTVTLNYLNIPFILKFDMGKVVNFQIGPQLGILLSGREKGTINNQPVDTDLKGVFKNDFSMVLGLGFNVTRNINFGGRLNYGLNNIYSTPQGSPVDYPSVSNRVFNFFVGYTL
jgi:hypothetical protein